jgi:hypothetical protein
MARQVEARLAPGTRGRCLLLRFWQIRAMLVLLPPGANWLGLSVGVEQIGDY